MARRGGPYSENARGPQRAEAAAVGFSRGSCGVSVEGCGRGDRGVRGETMTRWLGTVVSVAEGGHKRHLGGKFLRAGSSVPPGSGQNRRPEKVPEWKWASCSRTQRSNEEKVEGRRPGGGGGQPSQPPGGPLHPEPKGERGPQTIIPGH